ncbi:MAG TPA: hypothetical protein VLL72_02380, partial [Kiloniellales bacterium]|nr:hypothetical protein [Kiloniellales bacterium]
AMTVRLPSGFGTVSSSLIALPAPSRSLDRPSLQPVWLFAPGPPDRTPFEPVELSPDETGAAAARGH